MNLESGKYSWQSSSSSNFNNTSNIPPPDKSAKIKCPFCGCSFKESDAIKHISVCGRIKFLSYYRNSKGLQ